MDDEPLRIRLAVLEEIVRELIRSGVLTDEMIEAVANRLEADDTEAGEIAAHQARMLPIEAAMPTQSEWEAAQRRKRMRVISDGGNPAT